MSYFAEEFTLKKKYVFSKVSRPLAPISTTKCFYDIVYIVIKKGSSIELLF